MSVFDGDASFAVGQVIAQNERPETVAAPNAVGTFADHIAPDGIAGESDLHAIGGCMAKIVAKNNVIVTATCASIHGGLACPKEKPIARMGRGIVCDEVFTGLLVQQNTGCILATLVITVGVAAYIPIEPIVHDFIVATAVHTNTKPRIELERIVPYGGIVTARHE